MTIEPVRSNYVSAPELRLEDFEQDEPYIRSRAAAIDAPKLDLIDGVTVTSLIPHSDDRGSLCELLTARDGLIEPIVHVYHVTAKPRSCRAWVYHRLQYDRLAFVNGSFRIALYDVRAGSRTFGMLNVFVLGQARPALLRIPPFVIHGVQNMGQQVSTFVNMPTKAWDPNAPDKCRLPANDPRVPFDFNG